MRCPPSPVDVDGVTGCNSDDGCGAGLAGNDDTIDGEDSDSMDGDEFAMSSSSVEDEAESLKCRSVRSKEYDELVWLAADPDGCPREFEDDDDDDDKGGTITMKTGTSSDPDEESSWPSLAIMVRCDCASRSR